jgi:hypothetical protein
LPTDQREVIAYSPHPQMFKIHILHGMKNLLTGLGIMCFTVLQLQSKAQSDSLLFATGKYLVGEIKAMERGVLTMETPFSKSDFQVKWEEVTEIYTKSTMIISTTGGLRHYGSMQSDSAGRVVINSKYEGLVSFALMDIVYIKPIDKTFLDRINASIDLGYTRTKARNQRQFTIRSRVGYIAERYTVEGSFNSLSSAQDEAEDIDRTDANFTYIYILRKDYFAVGRLDFLQNTEQLLSLRSNYKIGGGKFLFRKNSLYWNVSLGISLNNENFVGIEDDRQGTEAWFGTEVNLFNIGDLSFFTNVFIYPSITEDGRLRIDYKTDLKYDLPLDFYIKTGLTLNYDNQAVQNAAQIDYVWQTTFGWSW